MDNTAIPAIAPLSQQAARSERARAWTYAFACGSGVAGLLWGSSILLIGSLEADNVKLVTAFLMAALSAAAIAGYTNSLLAFAAFVTPALLPYGFKLVWLNGEFHPIVATFIVFWGWLLWSMARHLNDGFKDSIALTLQNTLLIERLSRAKDRAEAASLAKTRFLANMSHELRTPLNAIIGYSEMITHRVLGPIGHPTYESYSGNVLASGRQLLRIVDRVLDISRIEAGTLDLSLGLISVPDLVSGAVKTVEDAAKADGITITCSLAADLPELVGDASRLRQVLLDLLSNAVKFTPPKGRIDIVAGIGSERIDTGGEARGGLEFTVADTGVGIAPELLAQVTTPFRQLENQDHLRRGRPLKQDVGQTDTGLGLPLARLLVERHGGKLEITSEQGRGTKVRVWLPSNKPSKSDREPHPAVPETLLSRSA
ncbi:MAG: HAMP domain-containing histidine kinase [Rhodospirillales bacterium]|nr:HAMP domain-containing histidine kinase [Rhodospirillales bacterium]